MFAERRYDTPRAWHWYWRAGAAFASIEPIGNVAGVRVGGNWNFDATLTFENHSTDYRLTDVVCRHERHHRRANADGLALGVSYGFGRDSRSR